jgi:hypothetical protein
MRQLVTVIVGGALLLGACSSSGSSKAASTTTVAAVTKADFVAKANAICTDYNSRIAQAAGNVSATTPQDQQVTLLQTKIIPLIRQEVADLRKLTPPAADSQQVAAIFDAVSSGLDAASQKLKTDPATALGTSYHPFTPADNLATTYGLTACASRSA